MWEPRLRTESDTARTYHAARFVRKIGSFELDHLVICERCRHGATLHAGDGCGALRCPCALNRETIIESALMLAKRDIHDAYRTLTPDR